ncbi:hypothetical protein HDV02_005865 [Globomyces sp. JEL0801]|nr:hypothetical protein HDV02_005865 [Globomyces sp. JEL0801]
MAPTINTGLIVRSCLVISGIASAYLIYSISKKPKRLRLRPKPIIEPIATPQAVSATEMESNIDDRLISGWAVDESENLLNLLYAISEEQTQADTIIHRSVSCNHCGVSPVRGWRFKCANCVDFDLCTNCEALQVHHKTHTFIKIRIPIPPLANPRSMIFPSFYPGIPWTNTASFSTAELVAETHFDSMEIIGLYEQFKSLSTIDSHDGGITKETFEKCLGSLRKESQLIIDRIFHFFDTDSDGIISFEEMVKGLSVLCKGTMAERIKVTFEGYDLDNDGLITRNELRLMFKSYFLLSMELVRGVVKVMEEGMLDSFDDEATKPVSAVFGAPNSTDDSSDLPQPKPIQDDMSDSPLMERNLSYGSNQPLRRQIATAINTDHEYDPGNQSLPSPSLHSPMQASRRLPTRTVSFDMNQSPKTLDMRPALPFMVDDEHIPIMESISQDAIEEMIQQVFVVANATDKEGLDIDDFRLAVDHDARGFG